MTTFTSSGTWNKDARTQMVTIYGWSGGGGGGSGRQGLTTLAGGGSGGSCGAFSFTTPAEFFGSSETVTIGAGGSGGAAQTSASTNGNNGNNGGSSYIGYTGATTASAAPNIGIGGNGGSTGTVGGHVSTFYISGASNQVQTSGGGNAANGSSALTQILSPSMGPGAGGAGADSTTARQGGTGAPIVGAPSLITILAGGAGGIEGGTINGSDGNPALSSGTGGILCGGSGGGGGGGQSVGSSAGNGGKGGLPGGGGGGGGGSINGTNSGAGGDGANGKIIVVEWF